MKRRGFLAGILAAGTAPAVASSGILMPVKKIITPSYNTGGVLKPNTYVLGEGTLLPGERYESISLMQPRDTKYTEFVEEQVRAITAGLMLSMDELRSHFDPSNKFSSARVSAQHAKRFHNLGI